ncbi:MAG TPA: MarR family transcriptional regulator [Pilimelia sp.]|nr:MarR family transcriptional regulator [Pilimelia sp.]
MAQGDGRRDTVDGIVAVWRAELPAVAGPGLELSKRAGRLSALLGEVAAVPLVRLGLTKAEYEVLAVLRAAGAPYRLRPTDLTSRLLLSSGGTSNLLRRLADAGLVAREADPRDARSSWVRLTTEGVVTAEMAVRAATAAADELLRGVPADVVRAAADAMRELLLELGDVPKPARDEPGRPGGVAAV